MANVTNYTVWFALTFWVYLETRPVFATGRIAGPCIWSLRRSGHIAPARDFGDWS